MKNTVYEQILYNVKNEILTITLNRPERLNAWTRDVMLRECLDAFDRADADDEIRAIIVTGAGRAFCAGVDLTVSYENPDKNAGFNAGRDRDTGGQFALRIFKCMKPVIAAINGPAVGVGITMTLPMDIRIAADTATFGFVFARRGIVPEACSSWFLPRIVGISKALEWTYSGRVFSAQEALAGGLIRSIHPGGKLLEAAESIAREIADTTSAVSISLTRQMMWRMLGSNHPMDAHKIDSRAVYYTRNSADGKEARAAFLEKRPVRFTGRPSIDMPEFYPWWHDEPFE